MNDLKNFKHGEEGEFSTHSACAEMVKQWGDKVVCCTCTGHQCKKDDVGERLLRGFLKELDTLVFVKKTDSETGEEEELNPVIEDMEAVIRISGEWDREDLKKVLISITGCKNLLSSKEGV